MTNAEIVRILVNKLSLKIESRMSFFDETYAQAKAKVSADTVAGSAVWEIIDAKYKGM